MAAIAAAERGRLPPPLPRRPPPLPPPPPPAFPPPPASAETAKRLRGAVLAAGGKRESSEAFAAWVRVRARARARARDTKASLTQE